jgi:hypothetical protein
LSGDPVLIINLQLFLIGPIILAFAGYRAFQLRRVLVGEVYRRRATWNAVFAIFLIPLQGGVLTFIGIVSVPTLARLALVVVVIASNIVGFLFLDSAISAARQVDFFLRDSLSWTKARYPIATVFLVGMLGTLFGPPSTIFTAITGSILWPMTWVYAAGALAYSSARANDKVIRNYAKWIGLFAISVAAGFLTPGLNLTVILLSLAVGSVFFYEATSALSLTGDLKTVRGSNPKRSDAVTTGGNP